MSEDLQKSAKDAPVQKVLRFANLGLEQEEKSARKTLRKNLRDIFDGLSREELAEPRAYVRLFPAFLTYTRSLLDAYAPEHASMLSEKRGLAEFLSAVVNQIAPWPQAKVEADGDPTVDPNESAVPAPTRESAYHEVLAQEGIPQFRTVEQFNPETEEVDQWEEEYEFDPLDHLSPDCLWEEEVSECSQRATVRRKLPSNYHYSFVFVMRNSLDWRGLKGEISYSLKLRLEELTEEAERPKAALESSREESSPFPKLESFKQLKIHVISDKMLQAWWPGGSSTWNFIELGFEDGRQKNHPIKLWERLLELAAKNGNLTWLSPKMPEMPKGTKATKQSQKAVWTPAERRELEKDVQRLRKHFRRLFGAPDDPIPFNKERDGYTAAFKISSVDLTKF